MNIYIYTYVYTYIYIYIYIYYNHQLNIEFVNVCYKVSEIGLDSWEFTGVWTCCVFLSPIGPSPNDKARFLSPNLKRFEHMVLKTC